MHDDRIRHLLKRVSAELHETREKLAEAQGRRREPIAIVGMGCRFPGGVNSPEDLWRMVAAGQDAITEFPADRGWNLDELFHPDPGHPGTSYARTGGFLSGPGDFDAEFFGISPREALAADPQHRLLLETTWETFERAGIDPVPLRASRTGVFVGTNGNDYTSGVTTTPEDVEGYLAIGNAASVASGRISYTFGFEGPAVTVDTACSASLVALHLAVRALRSGECDLAVAGGVTLMITPSIFVEFSRQRGLAVDGRCKAFAAAADGTGWSEGVGVVLVERLSDARRLGHRVLAVVRGSGVNQDGASNGLTAPNGPAQRRVILDALADAGLAPADVDAVEAHGTGTALGDPIEAQALIATYGRNRAEDRPVWLGSVKSNLGHTQAAAGAAGLIKLVMALRHGHLPKTLHVDAPSPHVDWSAGNVRLLVEDRPWPETGAPRRAGVSAFGVSGTNAHVILEQAPDADTDADTGAHAGSGSGPEGTGPLPFTVSAQSPGALRAQADRLAAFLAEENGPALPDVAHALATTRAILRERAVVVAGDRPELIGGLRALAAGEPAPGVVRGAAAPRRKVAFVFPGQGSQWRGMAAGLLGSSPVFAGQIAACEEALAPFVDWSLTKVLRGDTKAPSLDRVDVVQPALWAVMVSLAELWRSCGVRPDAVVGHSQGEVAAAYVAGALSLPDAAAVVALRSRVIRALSGSGGMASVGLPLPEAEARIARWEGALSIAAVNSSSGVVVSGEAGVLEEFLAACAADDVRTRRIPVDYASHSVQVERIREPLLDLLASVRPRAGSVPMLSTVTAGPLDTTTLDAGYWYTNLRQRVLFEPAIRGLLDEEYDVFVEPSPHPGLTTAVREIAEDTGRDGTVVTGSLRRDHGGLGEFLTALGQVHTHGVPVDWPVPSGERPAASRVDLPTYAFQRRRYWLPDTPGRPVDGTGLGLRSTEHPVLGVAVRPAGTNDLLLTGQVSVHAHPWLADHQVFGTVLVPGTAFAEWAIRAGDETGHGTLEELVVEAPLVLTGRAGAEVQVVVGARGDDDRRPVAVYSRPRRSEPDAEWTQHAAGFLGPDDGTAPEEPASWPPPGAERVGVESLYPDLAESGLAYGPAFLGTRAVWRSAGDVFAEVSLPRPLRPEAGSYGIHPALLDAAFHAWALTEGVGHASRLPFAWTGVRLYATGATALRVHLAVKGPDELSLLATDESGAPVISVDSLVTREVTADRLSAGTAAAHVPWRVAWTGLPASPAAGTTPERASSEWATFDVGDLAGGPSAPDESELPHTVRETTLRVLNRLREALGESGDRRLMVLTTRAVDTGDGRAPALAAAAVWGLVRSAQTEHPGRLLLVDSDGEEESGRALTKAVRDAIAADEPQIALRAGTALVPRLVRAVPDPDMPGWSFAPDGTVLITGGLGLIGRALARHLVQHHGVRHLVLATRRGMDTPDAADVRAELEELGARTTIARCDVTDRQALAELLAGIPARHPLTAVVHAAGALDDGPVDTLTGERLDTTLRPKADAAWNLHVLTEDRDLSAFVLFSSAAGVLGTAAQGNYAAANTFLDALAAYRRAHDLPGTSLAWGLWEEAGGLTARLDDADRRRILRQGVRPLTTVTGLALFDAAGRLDEALLVPAVLEQSAPAGERVPPMLRKVLRARRRTARAGDAGGSERTARLRALPEPERGQAVLDLVRKEAATVLGHAEPDTITVERAFKDLGFDSLTAVDLRNRLSAATGLRLAATLVFDHSTSGALARHLESELVGDRTEVPVPAAAGGTDDPVAIVGMACRFPGGVTTPGELWDLVAGGTDAITGWPAGRGWNADDLYDPDPDRPGTTYTTQGGFLHDADQFDAGFFGISPREALATDPQQRLLLETTWEALEHAGIPPHSLRESRTGVFTGVMYNDYATRLREIPGELEGFLPNGSAASVASGRVSYVFGFQGPAVSVDTACSSSLVAIHLAGQALRGGECDLALAGGVTVMASPDGIISACRQRALTTDGRIKAFAAAADGTSWAEGVGVLLLERLSDARANGHRVLAVIRGTAVNNDGASNGLTAPSGTAQRRVIRRALAVAGVGAGEVDVVEAHGTGTRLGDPIEVNALLAVYGAAHSAEWPLWLGSLKSNVGHAQAAAGVGGVIKMVLALEHGVLPATLHVDEPTPHVDWGQGTVRLLTRARAWPETGRPRRAAVSAFGISGTNAHLVLEQPPAEDVKETGPTPPETGTPLPYLISATTPAALRDQATRLHAFITGESALAPPDVAHSLLETRSVFERRAVVIARDRAELLDGLDAVARDEPADRVVRGAADVVPKTVFVFPGQGSQWRGMAARLLDSAPVFADHISACADALAPHVDWSLVNVLRGADDAPSLDRVDVVQPALWAMMVSLAQLWRSYGVEPDAVVGHSQGEIAAAYVAGALSLSDAAMVVARRSKAILALAGRGGMLSVALPAEDAETRIKPWADALSIAAVNGPSGVVVAGEPAALDELAAACRSDDVRTRRIPVDYASHSAQVEGVRESVISALGGVRPRTGSVPLLSTVTGEWIDTAGMDAGYWYTNLRRTVRFEEAIRTAGEEGHTVFVEVSPHPGLTGAILDTLAAADVGEPVVTETLRRDQGGLDRLLTSVATAGVRGVPVDWRAAFAGRGARRVTLPAYAFQRQRYWLDTDTPNTTVVSGALPTPAAEDANAPSLAARLASLPETEHAEVVLDLVRRQTAAVVGRPDLDAVGATTTFKELGFESLTAVDLRNRLAAATGLRLPTTLVFDHPTPGAVARYLRSALDLDEAAPSSPALATVERLEAMLAGEVAGHERAEIGIRLRALATRWGDASGGLEQEIDFESATDEELFQIMDSGPDSTE